MGIYDVPAGYLIEEVTKKLASELENPAFIGFAKTGRHRERAPQREDWFFVRAASILYRAYKEGTIGTQMLRTYYGGKRNRGIRKEHFYRASGKVVRSALQQLEKNGYIQRAEPKGRKITGKGLKLLNECSKIAKTNWEQGKYTKKEKKVSKGTEEKAKEDVREALKQQEKKKERHKAKREKPKKKQEKPKGEDQ